MLSRRSAIKTLFAGASLLILGLTGCGNEPDKANAAKHTSNVVATSFYSPVLGIDWNYDVYLPRSYNADDDATYPVIYMMHGLYGNHRNLLERFNSQQMLDGACDREGREAIAVFIDGFNSFYINSNEGMQMEDAIMHDLVPYIEKTYKISSDQKDHAIGGISMGGYGAARLALKYSDYFSKAILISPAVWYTLAEDNAIYKSQHAFSDGGKNWSWDFYNSVFPSQYLDNANSETKFYIETTSDDKTVAVENVDKFVDELQSAKIDCNYIRDSGDDHNWTYWAKAAPKAYAWVLNQFI